MTRSESIKNIMQAMGRIGGTKSRNGGFYVNHELATIAGRRGGLASRRGKTKNL